MSVTQILAAQPWVRAPGLDAASFSLAGCHNRHHLCRRPKVRHAHPGPQRPVSPRLCGTRRDGVRPGRNLDSAARTGAGSRRHPHSTDLRCSNRARSIALPGASGWCIPCPAMPGPFLSWVVAFWLAGATAFSLRLLFAWMAAERLRYRMVRPAPAEWQGILDRLKSRLSIARPVRLLVSGLLDAPAAIGWLRPIVLVPAGALTGLPPAQIEALLLHELAHVRRYDYLVHILQSAMEAIFFYHPAVWYVSAHMRAERELCCDDTVVSITGDAVAYVRALAEFDAARWIRPAVMAANGGALSARMARLLGQPPASRRTSGGPASAAALILLAIGGWAIFAQSTAQPRFEVASVKPSGNPGIQHVRPLPGRLTADASLRILMQYAYGVQPFQVIGGPERVMSARYEIDAKAGGNAGRTQMFLMLRSLLEDRYQLKTHREARDLPAYALVAATRWAQTAGPERRRVRGFSRRCACRMGRWKNGGARRDPTRQGPLRLRERPPGARRCADARRRNRHAGTCPDTVAGARPECNRQNWICRTFRSAARFRDG